MALKNNKQKEEWKRCYEWYSSRIKQNNLYENSQDHRLDFDFLEIIGISTIIIVIIINITILTIYYLLIL